MNGGSSVVQDVVDKREIALAKGLLEGRGKSKGELMIEAGYTESRAKNPQQVLNTRSFQAILSEIIPDDLVVSRHAELIKTENEAVSLGATKLAYQVKGRLQPENSGAVNLQVSFSGAPKTYEFEGGVIDIDDRYIVDQVNGQTPPTH